MNKPIRSQPKPLSQLVNKTIADAFAKQGFANTGLVTHWPERDIAIDCAMDAVARSPRPDIVVFAVRHREYLGLDADRIATLFPTARVIVDANNVLTNEVAQALAGKGIAVAGVGKGHWRALNRRERAPHSNAAGP